MQLCMQLCTKFCMYLCRSADATPFQPYVLHRQQLTSVNSPRAMQIWIRTSAMQTQGTGSPKERLRLKDPRQRRYAPTPTIYGSGTPEYQLISGAGADTRQDRCSQYTETDAHTHLGTLLRTYLHTHLQTQFHSHSHSHFDTQLPICISADLQFHICAYVVAYLHIRISVYAHTQFIYAQSDFQKYTNALT